MKHARVIGLIWILFSVYVLYLGLIDLYGFSDPKIVWVGMTPFSSTWEKLFLGAFGLVIGTSRLKNKRHPKILPFTITVLFYLIIDSVQMGKYMMDYSSSTFGFFALAIVTTKLKESLKLAYLKSLLEPKNILFITLGMAPFLLYPLIGYHWFEFLH